MIMRFAYWSSFTTPPLLLRRQPAVRHRSDIQQQRPPLKGRHSAVDGQYMLIKEMTVFRVKYRFRRLLFVPPDPGHQRIRALPGNGGFIIDGIERLFGDGI